MDLSPAAQRVLGALAEKRRTTPQQYPLTLNALVAACNQRSARDPVLSLTEGEVQQALRELREHELARTAGLRGRAPRYEHRLDLQLDLDEAAQSVLGVLLLRGPQTVGELRTRTERWHPFADLAAVEQALARLAAHPFLPLVAELGREPGRRETRWTHLLGDPADDPVPAPAPTSVPPAAVVDGSAAPATAAPARSTPAPDGLAARVAALEAAVAALRADLDVLLDELR